MEGFSADNRPNWSAKLQAGTEKPAVTRAFGVFGFAAVTKLPPVLNQHRDNFTAPDHAAQVPTVSAVSRSGDLQQCISSDGPVSAIPLSDPSPIGQRNGQRLSGNPSPTHAPHRLNDRSADWHATPQRSQLCSSCDEACAVTHRRSGRCVLCELEWWPA